MWQRYQLRLNARKRASRCLRCAQVARPGVAGEPRRRSTRPARARRRHCPRTCTRTGAPGSRVLGAVPAPGAGGSSRVRAGGGSCRRGGCPRAALVHSLHRSRSPAPPPPRPPLLPRAGSARPKSRACARVRRPGPSRGGPVDSNESVARSRINPFPAHPFRGPVGFRACASRRRAFPLARTAHAREGGGAGGGVHGRLDILCSCRRRAPTIRDVHDSPPRPLPKLKKKKKIQNTLPPTVPPRPASIPSPACVQ